MKKFTKILTAVLCLATMFSMMAVTASAKTTVYSAAAINGQGYVFDSEADPKLQTGKVDIKTPDLNVPTSEDIEKEIKAQQDALNKQIEDLKANTKVETKDLKTPSTDDLKAKADEQKANAEKKANDAKAESKKKADEAKADAEKKTNDAKLKADDAKAKAKTQLNDVKGKLPNLDLKK